MDTKESAVVDRESTAPGDNSVSNASTAPGDKSISNAPVSITKSVSKCKSVEPDSWDPAEYQRDAEYFALTCGLPCEGLNPLKVSDISDAMLIAAFGEKGRNGYKLNQCVDIPVEDLLQLSQVVDGYDKPVNGVLSHSFVKGVYAERIQKRPVNWAAYASTKLRGQITQWEREKKGKPEGPPCIRKHRRYNPPRPGPVVNVLLSEHPQDFDHNLSKDIVVFDAAAPRDDFRVTDIPSIFKEKADRDGLPSVLTEKQPTNLLLSMLRHSLSASSATELLIRGDMAKIEAKLEEWKKSVLEQPRSLQEFETPMGIARTALSDVRKLIETTSVDIESLVSDIELEGNKEDDDVEDATDYCSILEARLDATRKAVDDLRGREATILKDEKALKELYDSKLKSFEELPKKVDRAKSLLKGLETDLKAVLSQSEAQTKEQQILASVLEKPSPMLRPRFIPTSTRTVGTQISLTSCPVCCNGYHCYNWIPASCGHTYHPSCLFPLIGGSKNSAPQCCACGEVFSPEWLRCWGLEQAMVTLASETKCYVDEMRDCYEKHSGRLGRRRELAAQIQSVQERGHGHAEVELRNHSSLEATSVIDLDQDDVEIGSSKKGFLTPKVEDDSPGKKRKAVKAATQLAKTDELAMRWRRVRLKRLKDV